MSRPTEFHDIKIDTGDPEENFFVSVQLLRGKIINHFANVEFMFADIHFRALMLPIYGDLSPNLPYTVKSRIAAVKQLATAPGPIQAYGQELVAIADEFASFERLRQFVAHGNMLVKFDRPQPLIIFHVYDQPKKSPPILSERVNTLAEFYASYMEIALYADRVVRLLYTVFTTIPLPAAV